MSQTVAGPTLSGETRQCACGGWTRFVVCQYCGTTDPAVAAAGWVSSSPLTVPTAFDPAAVPPPAMATQLPPPVPAPMTGQHDAPMMAAATSAFADLHAAPTVPTATPAAAAPPIASSPVPEAFPPPPAAPVPPAAPSALAPAAHPAPDAAVPGPAPAAFPPPPAAFPPPPAAEAAVAYTPAGDPGASLVGAGAPGTYPAPLPVPPGAAWPQDAAEPAVPSSALLAASEAAAAPRTRVAQGRSRPRWMLPAVGVAVVAVAGGAYVLFGRSSSSDQPSALPVHHVARLTPGLLTGTVPAGFAAAGTPVTQKVAEVRADQAPGHPLTGALAAESLDAKNAKGVTVSALAVQFPTPAAASTWAALKAPTPKGQLVSYVSRGVFAFAVETTSAKDAAASAAVNAWTTSLGA